jgi:hypothetical protein
VQPSEFYSGYYALPLAPDGFPFRYSYFKASGWLFRFDRNGIMMVDASLPKPAPVGTYAIRSAQEVFARILAEDSGAGMLEGGHSSTLAFASWYRAYPQDETITLYGWMRAFKPLNGGQPLVTLDNHLLKGDLSAVQEFGPSPQFAQATGRFHAENGLVAFEIDSWQPLDSQMEEAPIGTLQQQGDRVVLVTTEGETLVMPDVSADRSLPSLPMENVFVIGVRQGDVFQWKSLDLRMAESNNRGGGGGGGIGLYKLNLSGTPIAFPTATPVPQATLPVAGGGAAYTILAGDTLHSIAAAFGTVQRAERPANDLCRPGDHDPHFRIPES